MEASPWLNLWFDMLTVLLASPLTSSSTNALNLSDNPLA
jgi:hypothetical protein